MEETTEQERWNTLTERESAVAIAIGAGLTNHQIAGTLGINIKTYDTHRGHILKKLKAQHAVDVCLIAIRLGYVKP